MTRPRPWLAAARRAVIAFAVLQLGLAVAVAGLWWALTERKLRRAAGLAGLIWTRLPDATAEPVHRKYKPKNPLEIGTALLFNARAMARDLHDATEAAIVISRLTMVMVLAPMVAPLLGGIVHDALGWRAVFAFLALLAGWAALAVASIWLTVRVRQYRVCY